MAAPPLKVWRLDLLFSWLATVVKASGPTCPLVRMPKRPLFFCRKPTKRVLGSSRVVLPACTSWNMESSSPS